MKLQKYTSFWLRAAILLLTTLLWSTLSIADTQVDVSGQVQVTRSKHVCESVAKACNTKLTLTNTLIPISSPLRVVIDSIVGDGVTLANATGVTVDGKPYVEVPLSGDLLPGATLRNVKLQFMIAGNVGDGEFDDDKAPFSFTTKILAVVKPQITSTSVTDVVDSDGKVLELPGVAKLSIPPGSTTSVAASLSTVTLPELAGILATESNYTDPGTEKLKIKLSTYLDGPVDLKISLPSELQAGSVRESLQLVSVEPYPEGEGDTPASSLRALDGRLCDSGTAYCTTLDRGNFLPIPADPNDPFIQIALLTTVGTASNTTPLSLITPIKGSVEPTSLAAIDSSVTFKAKFDLKKNFDISEPLSGGLSIISAFKELRSATMSRHTGLDLKTQPNPQQPVYSVLAGAVHTKGPVTGKRGTCPTSIGKDILGITLSHPEKSFLSRYLHLSPDSIFVNKNDPVPDQEWIAVSGASGACPNSIPNYHLHFDVMPEYLKFIDPRPLLPAVNDTGLYLFPHDNGSPATKDIGHSEEPHLRLRLVDLPNGNQLWRIIDKVKVSDFAMSQINYLNGEGQSGSLTPLSQNVKSSLQVLSGDNGKYAEISYESNPINLKSVLQFAALSLGGITVDDFLQIYEPKVVLELCTFRLGPQCSPNKIAEWALRPSTTLVNITMSGTGTGKVTSTPSGIDCGDGTQNNCQAVFTDSAVILTAAPSVGNTFTGWSGDGAGSCAGTTSTTCTIPMDGKEKNITATFGNNVSLPPDIVGTWNAQHYNGNPLPYTYCDQWGCATVTAYSVTLTADGHFYDTKVISGSIEGGTDSGTIAYKYTYDPLLPTSQTIKLVYLPDPTYSGFYDLKLSWVTDHWEMDWSYGIGGWRMIHE